MWWGIEGAVEEGLRFAYVASQLMPASMVVGAAAVVAGLLGAAAVRKARAVRPTAPSHTASVRWVLGIALLANSVAATLASGAAASSCAELALRRGVSCPADALAVE